MAEKFTRPVRVIVHPDAFLERYVKQPGGGMMRFPDFRPDLFAGGRLVFETHKAPVLLAGGQVTTTGEIPRRTDYEKGFPPQMSVLDGKCVPDVEVWDDQAIVFVVEGKGAVIVSGCGHVNRQYDWLRPRTGGGRKTSGSHRRLSPLRPTPDVVVRRTLEDLKQLNPDFLVPCHCTGWDTTRRIAGEMPEQFLLSTVGCTIRF